MRLVVIFLCMQVVSCSHSGYNLHDADAKIDVRLGNSFYSLYLDKDCQSYVVKGTGTNYMDSLIVFSADTSDAFTLDSLEVFLDRLGQFRPTRSRSIFHNDAPRIEVYYLKSKIIDTYYWDPKIWDLVRPIMYQIPKGYNPFRVSDQPFG